MTNAVVVLVRHLTKSSGRHSLVIEFRGECDYRPEELLVPPKHNKGRLNEARKFLLDILEAGPVEQRMVKAKAAEIALAWRTVERANEMWAWFPSARAGGRAASACGSYRNRTRNEAIERQALPWRSMTTQKRTAFGCQSEARHQPSLR